jgi:HD-GYP domain-containing protein (c-di-GMP phosphodiesterase class II)
MSVYGSGSELRTAELVASLSLAMDLGMGQPMEHAQRSCLLGLRLADDLGLEESERVVLYYVCLLAWIGCHGDSYEMASLFGDDIAARAGTRDYDLVGLDGWRYLARHVGAGRSVLGRAKAFGSFAVSGWRTVEEFDGTHCAAAGDFALRLGLDPGIRDALQHSFERWDGKGGPHGLSGEELALSARIVQLVDFVVAWYRIGGVEGAIAAARERRGGQLDPDLVDRFCRLAPVVLPELDATPTWDALIEAEPALRPTLGGEELDAALEAVADFADLKSPYFTGHSRAVAALMEAAASQYGLPSGEGVKVRRAALIQDIGRLGVSNAIWDKQGPLSPAEVERVRLHPYFVERMFARPPLLAELGALAAMHHERCDGFGYPRGLPGGALPPSAKLLAAADCYQALVEPRPHRPAVAPEEAEPEIRLEVRAGRLDGEAVDAVLAAAGHRVRRRRQWPAGLTPREVEVLRVLARGASNKEIARELVISPKTAGNHVEHIYVKTGARTRAGASLFAMKHGLLDAEIGQTPHEMTSSPA